MEEQPEKLPMSSMDIGELRRADLARLFPEARTEGGKIDFNVLRQLLGDAVDAGKERYGLTWPGKADCIRTIQQLSYATLRPDLQRSVDFDGTENLCIEGDNLEVLRLLQKSYLSRIKMIFIDPPYNTGGDFIYPDDFSETLQTYLRYTGQVDNDGRRFSTNTESDGRFHSRWLNMMYPRLYLARNLLTDDGCIFITIDDQEVDNLRKVCYEIFGEENFVAQIEWQKRYTRSNNTDDFTSVIDHIIVFRKSEAFRPQLAEREEEANARYSNPDNDPRGPWKAIPFLNPLSPEERPNLAYDIVHPSGRIIKPTKKAWRSSKAVWEQLSADGRVWWGRDGSSDIPNVKRFLSEVRQGMTPINFWDHEFAGHTDLANQEIKEIFGDKIFDTPKPTKLIRRMIETACAPGEDAIILDFFAGSGSTGHAVLDSQDISDAKRSFILVQLPELTGRADFRTISDITIERMRRVVERKNASVSGELALQAKDKVDRGFRSFRLDQSCFTEWDGASASSEESLSAQLRLHVDHVRPDRSEMDILFEILLKSGFALTTKVKAKKLAGKTVFQVEAGAMLVCLERKLTLELIRAMAELRPERIVCLDEGFAGNDQLKANAVQTFRTKGVASFRTV
ncbi:MAG: site-specific DNA-methyltransferase [Hyphomonadaceae bacterium]